MSSAKGASASHVARAQGPAPGQETFANQQDAANALINAVQSQNNDDLRRILGPEQQHLLSGDKVEDANDMKRFSQSAADQWHLENKGDSTAILYVGPRDWPFPIPLEKTSDGKWYWDTPAGEDRILARRIGRNELDAIRVCHAYVDAQRDYASADRDGSDVLKYAQRFISRPGTHDGLYWPVSDDQAPSPLGPLVAQASEEGYSQGKHQPFHGYRYKILKAQGPDAPGGAYDYVINGNMIAGFAMVAWPDKYGSSGVQTFIVNHRGKIYQKDLGPDTDAIARQMTEYNPDSSWKPATD